jgi:hypothetical protein
VDVDEKYNIILSAEQAFAREVALGVVIKRPLTAWYYLLPGMFIFDYLKRNRVIRDYSRHFLFPRKLAIAAARLITEGEDRKACFSQIEEDVKSWLTSLKLYSEDLVHAQIAVVHLLTDHYLNLLNTEGEDYHSLVHSAYQKRSKYEMHLQQVTDLENVIDQAIIERTGGEANIREKLRLEALQVKEQRQKWVERIFLF